ncbi:hypothetical protein BDN70DRAFT_455300 [Pholiota conissans]|uniref:Uncharacterized protein n=1 Tax=Pholiota conissans TaxID=109636 RepID=A0A9P5YPA2_9AGAR|nr:hypothetical protein BDN70DRAFT_455300 [Pholiota conissans]
MGGFGFVTRRSRSSQGCRRWMVGIDIEQRINLGEKVGIGDCSSPLEEREGFSTLPVYVYLPSFCPSSLSRLPSHSDSYLIYHPPQTPSAP